MLVDWSIFFSHDDDDDEVFGIFLGGGWETSLDSLSLLWIFFVVFVVKNEMLSKEKSINN